MQLHRIEGQAEWADIARTKQNGWQRTAAGTHGFVTPGNFLTVVGFGLVMLGLAAVLGSDYWWGTVWLIAGRLMDIADGWAADLTGTKSPLGEALDAGFDKLATLLILMTLPVAGIVPWLTMIALLLPHLLIALYTTWAHFYRQRVHPSRVGKISMALAWLGLIGFVIAAAAGGFRSPLTALSYTLVAGSIGLALFALVGYLRPQPAGTR